METLLSGAIFESYITTLFLGVFLAVGMTSLLYWVNDRTVSPFIVRHRKGIIRLAALIYLAVLYEIQAMQYRLDPQMSVFGWHWAFLNLMLVSLYVIIVDMGDWFTATLQGICCGIYLWFYADPFSPVVIATFVIWLVVLTGLYLTRERLMNSRLASYVGMLILGLSGIIGIYVSRPRTFDAWWWVRELTSFVILGIAVTEYRRTIQQTDAKTAELQSVAAYQRLAHSDVFTDDPRMLTQMFTSARSNREPLAVVTLDVDHFSAFNQRYGYLAGNIALVDVADVLQETLTQGNVNARLFRSEGEEFSIGIAGETAEQVAETVKTCLERIHQKQFAVGGEPVVLTASAGIAMLEQADETIDDVYKRADDQLQLSKKYGRNKVSGSGVPETIAVAAPKPLAFFEQEIIDVTPAGNTKWGAELLLRAKNPRNQQWELPERFDISVEQQISFITEVLIRDRDLKRMTINLTLAQFSNSNTANSLAGFTTAAYGPETLIIEITTVPDLSTIRRVTALYRSAGVKIYIDDVGSDNSYELVRNILPYIDGVKFAIQNLRPKEADERIQERIAFWAEIAENAGIDFILEGVETNEDMAFAQGLGVSHYQGFYFGKPVLPGRDDD